MIDDYLRRHDGVITLEQARAAGMHKDAVRRRVLSGHWRRLSHGVCFVDDRPFIAAARVRATVWGYGSSAVASGIAAAWWHGVIERAPDIVEVTVPRNSHGRRRPGTRPRRRDLKSSDIVERRGLLVTSLELTVVEAAARKGGGAAVMNTALQRHTELPPLWRAHLGNKGRCGSPHARQLLHVARDGGRSQAERIFISLLKRAGITDWVTNHPAGGYVVDFAFPASRVAIKIDGWAFHQDATVFGRTSSRCGAGRCSDSPGRTSSRIPTASLPRSGERFRRAETRSARCGVRGHRNAVSACERAEITAG